MTEPSLFDNYWVCHPPEEIAPSLFSALHGKEWYRTCGFKEIAFAYGTTEMSYRQASTLVNRVRHQSGATPSRTLRENVESEGREVMSFLEQQAQSILEEAGFTPEGIPSEGIPTEAATGNSCNSVQYDSSQTLLSLPAEQVEQVIRACAPRT